MKVTLILTEKIWNLKRGAYTIALTSAFVEDDGRITIEGYPKRISFLKQHGVTTDESDD